MYLCALVLCGLSSQLQLENSTGDPTIPSVSQGAVATSGDLIQEVIRQGSQTTKEMIMPQ
jgi:hypothetical protein